MAQAHWGRASDIALRSHALPMPIACSRAARAPIRFCSTRHDAWADTRKADITTWTIRQTLRFSSRYPELAVAGNVSVSMRQVLVANREADMHVDDDHGGKPAR